MAATYEKQLEEPEIRGLSFEDRFGLPMDCHWTRRENQALAPSEETQTRSRALRRNVNYR